MYKHFNCNLTLGTTVATDVQVNLYTIEAATDLDENTDNYVSGSVTVSVAEFDNDAYGDDSIAAEVQEFLSDELGVQVEVNWSEDGLQDSDSNTYDFDFEIDVDDLRSVISSFEE